MEDDTRTRPTSATRASDAHDSHRTADAGKMPTDEEEKAAEGAADALDADGVMDGVAENYKEMIKRGADQKGEGRI